MREVRKIKIEIEKLDVSLDWNAIQRRQKIEKLSQRVELWISLKTYISIGVRSSNLSIG